MPQLLKVLIIEDTPNRKEILTSLYRKQAWVLVSTGARAITLLTAYKFDLISLDFNLNGELTGADVAQQISNTQNNDTKILIHSMNPRGAKFLSEILPDALVYPVLKMVRSNKIFKRIRQNFEEQGLDYNLDN